MNLKLLLTVFFIVIAISFAKPCASSLFDNKVKLNYLVGFQNDAAMDSEINIKFYDQLNQYKKLEGLSFKEFSYLINLLDLKGDNARFRWKGNIFPDTSLSVSDYNIGLNGDNSISLGDKNSVFIINRTSDEQAIKVFDTNFDDICSISMILYQDSKATYLTTSDSFGLYLGEKDTMNECRQNLDNDIKLIDKLPLGVKDKDIRQAENLAHLLNTIKDKHQLTNSQIGKMIAMSNIDIGIKELIYPETYGIDNLTIFHESYQINNDSINKPITIEDNSNPKLIIFSTNYENETVLLGSTELEEFNDLKLIIYKQGSTYLYDINKMKHRTVIQD